MRVARRVTFGPWRAGLNAVMKRIPDAEDDGPIGPEGLTNKQALFVKALVAGRKQGEAAVAAGYVGYPDSNASRLVRLPHIQRAIQRETERRLLVEGIPSALEFMVNAPGNVKLPGAVRFQAAKWVMEAAGHGLAAQRAALGLPGDDKPLDEMSPGELEQFLKAGLGAIEQIKSQRERVIDHGARNGGSDPMAAPMQVADFVDVEPSPPLSE